MIRYQYPSWYFSLIEWFQNFGVARLLVTLSFKSVMKSYGFTAQLKPLCQMFAQRNLFLRTFFQKAELGGGGGG